MREPLLSHQDGVAEIAKLPSHLIRPGQASTEPSVSIAIPQYRRPQMLRQALRSALAQTTDATFEVLVVDDDPDPLRSSEIDRVVDDLNDARVRLFRNARNLGVYGNWCKCLQLARGRWVTLMDNDDLMSDGFLSACLDVVEHRPDARLVGTRYAIRDARKVDRDRTSLQLGHRLKNRLLYGGRSIRSRRLGSSDFFVDYPFAGVTGVLMDRECALSIGGFYPGHWPAADAIFIARFIQAYPSYLLPAPLVTCQIFDNAASRESVMEDLVRQGLELREELIPRLGCCPDILRWYARLKALGFLHAMYATFHGKRPPSALLDRLGLPKVPARAVYWLANAATLLLPVWLWSRWRHAESRPLGRSH